MPALNVHLARVVALLAVLSAVTGVCVVVARAPWAQAALPPPPATAAPAGVPAPRPPTPRPSHRAARPAPRPSYVEAAQLSNFWGVDISWPQCETTSPRLPAGFVVVGINGGRPFTDNPCMTEQLKFAKHHSGYAAYLNVDAPRGGDPAAYGRDLALDGLRRARAAGIKAHVLWLDVELLNHWDRDPAVNVAVINGAITALRKRSITAGVYSSGPMWQQITGGARVSMPVWLATAATDYRAAQEQCRVGLGGHPALMVQYVAGAAGRAIDIDVLCGDAVDMAGSMFTAV